MGGLGAGSAGIDPDRVAELLVDLHGTGPGRRGSGYRISASAVLTAAHVVRDAARVRVRFNADRSDGWMTEGVVDWSDATVDAALVTIAPRPQEEGRVSPVDFGRVADRDAVLECKTVGFPRFKLRKDPSHLLDDGSPSQYRDSAHEHGTISVLSNRRQGTLEVSVRPPEWDPDPARSPWEGMSGAAVWSGGRIIGLVAEHHRADGLGRLTATRVDRWYEQVARDRLDQLRRLLPALPADGADLVDVVPATAGERLLAGHTAQVRDIAPERLIGREEELAELVRFCAGEERYLWWQADPWTGKSALAAWFVLHPPPGVTPAWFFVTRELQQTDSDAFTWAMVEQLAAIAGEAALDSATPAGREREWRRLLEQAAQRVAERQERLVLVIDGLDEDEGPRSGKPSIASRLPKRPSESVRVMVTSRSHPDVREQVEHDHPLQRCSPRPLDLSPYAPSEHKARRELREHLKRDPVHLDVISFVTAAGGLTLRELSELTGQLEWALDDRLRSVFGRSLALRTPLDSPSGDQAERVYVFAHGTLRAVAEQDLAGNLDAYRRRIDTWADEYRRRRWPRSTPRYLLRPYGQSLAANGTRQRLVALATDTARHDRLLASTKGDAAGLAEIAAAQQCILSEDVPDLAAMGRLAVYRDRLDNRNKSVSRELPALWVRLNQFDRAEELVRSIREPFSHDRALAAMARAFADLGEWDRAEQTANRIPHDYRRNEAVTTIATALATSGQVERAQRNVRSHGSSYSQAQALAAVVETLVRSRQWDHAEHVAHSIPQPHKQAQALATVALGLAAIDPQRAAIVAADAEEATRDVKFDEADTFPSVARALAVTGAADRAEQVARSCSNSFGQVEALAALGAALAEVDSRRAQVLGEEAERAARDLHNSFSGRDRALAAVVEVFAELGQWDRAQEIARHLWNDYTRTSALTMIAKALAASGHWERVPQIVLGLRFSFEQAKAVVAVVGTLAERRQWDQAEQIARSLSDPRGQAQALTTVALDLTKVDPGRAAALAADAQQIAYDIDNIFGQADALTMAARVLAVAGDAPRAEQAARSVPVGFRRSWALTEVGEVLARTDPDRAADLAAEAEQIARRIPNPHHQAATLAALSSGTATVNPARAAILAAEAEQTAQGIRGSSARTSVLAVVARALARFGRRDLAEQMARQMPEAYDQSRVLVEIVETLASTGQAGHAEDVARGIADQHGRAQALAGVAVALAEVDPGRAARLIEAAEASVGSDGSLGQQRARIMVAKALAAIGEADRAEQLVKSSAVPSGPLSELLKNMEPFNDHAKAEKVEGLAGVAVGLARVDPGRAAVLAGEAEQIAQDIYDDGRRSWAQVLVAEALAGIGEWERSEQVARGIASPGSRSKALTGVAQALLGGGVAHDGWRRLRARQIVARVLAEEHWLDAVQALDRLDPSALVMIDGTLHGLDATQPP